MTPDHARALAAEFGSPLYVYELDRVRAAADRLTSYLPAPSSLLYSLKANPHPELARVLHDRGCRAELSSTGELAAAVDGGFDPASCLYTGPGKTAGEIGIALAAGVRRFSVESAVDHQRVAEVAAARGVTAECLIRVQTTTARGGSGVRMSGVASPFGVPADELLADPERFATRPGARTVGLHFYPLSNARDEATLIAELTASVAEAGRIALGTGLPLEVVDLGGGFAAPYAGTGELPGYPTLRAALTSALDAGLPDWRDGSPGLAFESGRYLTADCGTLVATVSDVKTSHGRTFVVLDSGINHLGGLTGLGRMLSSADVLPPAAADDTAVNDDEVVATVVGPLCTPADVLARRTVLAGPVAVGDVVTVPNVGAYGLTASLLGFLGRPPATEVVLDGGRVRHVSRLTLARTEVSHRPGPGGASCTTH